MKYKPLDCPPSVNIPSSVDVIGFTTHHTPAGATVHCIKSSELDLVRISVVFRAGSRYQHHPFTASATVGMLAEGTASHTSEELSEMLDYYGIYYNTSIDRDYSIITLCCLNKFLDKTLDFLTEILSEPLFSEKELAVYASKRKQNLTVERTRVDVMATELFWKSIYGENHPYGKSSPETAYDTLTTDHLKRFFADHYNIENSFTVVSGNIEPGFVDRISAAIDTLPHGQKADCPIDKPCSVSYAKIDKPDALQSSLRMGRVLFDANHPDYVTMQVAVALLGGYFGSRLVRNLREDKGYTYGIVARTGCFEESGYLVIATQVSSQHTRASIDEIFSEIEQLRTYPVPDSELDMVKSVMIGEMMRVLDGPFGICDVSIENIQNNTDNLRIEQIVNTIKQTTPDDIMRVARQYLNRDDITVVIAG